MSGIIRIAVLIVALVIASAWAYTQYSQRSVEGTSGLYSSTTLGAPSRKIDVLFIGDSYVFVDNLPKMLTDVASSDPSNTVEIETQSVTRGGTPLSGLLAAGDATNMINARHWDYVVLQEQSTWYLDEDQVDKTFDAAASFAHVIRAVGAAPVIFMTWIREPGSQWYQPPYIAEIQSPEHMQTLLDNATTLLGTSIDAPVVLVGDAWASVLKNDRALSLYQSDGSHPTPAGTYLAALMFYHFLTHNQVDQVAYLPDGVSPADNAYLRQVVDGY